MLAAAMQANFSSLPGHTMIRFHPSDRVPTTIHSLYSLYAILRPAASKTSSTRWRGLSLTPHSGFRVF